MNDEAQLKQFLETQKYMTIAVVLDDGTPWAAPVRIKTQNGPVFEWDSKNDTEHSKAIEARPAIAISIWTPEAEDTIQFGFYATATAKRLGEPNEYGISRYRATVTKAWINDATFVKREVSMV